MDELARDLLGIGSESGDLNALQMALRAAVLYCATVVIVRLGKKRFMSKATAFDVILGIILGSIISRAVTGNAPLLPSLAAAMVLMAMHWLFSWIALYSRLFGVAVKGRSRTLIRDGIVDEVALARAHMTTHDLEEDLRSQGVADAAKVKEARLERSGVLSVIKK